VSEAEDRLFAVYNEKLIALSSQADQPRRLAAPEFSAKAVSPVCGSVVELDFNVREGRISDFGYAVEACALTKAVVAVMARAIIGKTRIDVEKAGAAMKSMLEGGKILPAGDWADLGILEPVRDYKARHDSILLPFEAVEKAFAKGKTA
jgi:NifU-like protein involved in Fe-S cluster formation